MREITIRHTSDHSRVIVETPYHPSFLAAAKNLGGKWDATRKAWNFDARDEQRVRDLCVKLFGTDGTAPAAVCTVVVRLGLDAPNHLGAGAELWLCGRQIARRAMRDAAVRLGEGVIVLTGGFPGRGGSAKYPDLNPDAGTILEVRDVPQSLALAAVERYPLAVSIGTADTLFAARDALRAKLEEEENR